MFEVDLLPPDVTTDEVEAFFAELQKRLRAGTFRGPPADWQMVNRVGMQPGTGSMRIGELVAGNSYVVWCWEGEAPMAAYLAAVIRATE
jgi:hypothetical protein